MKTLPVLSVVRTRRPVPPELEDHVTTKISSSKDLARIASALIGDSDREMFIAIHLDSRNKLLDVHTVSVGSLTGSLVHPREVFKAAIISNSCAIVIAHCHPSGDTKPSPEDDKVTERLVRCGCILGVKVLDHVVVNHDGSSYYSYADKGKIAVYGMRELP